MAHKIFTKIVVIFGNLLILPLVLILRWRYKEVYGFRVYLETNEITEDAMYAYIVRPFDVCGLLSDYIDWSKDYPQYEEGVTNASSPLVLIDMKSIKEGDVIVFDSFEKFDEYRENRDKPNKTNGFIIKKLMTTTQRRRGLFLQ
jgi:hypothetical protein